MIGKLKVAVATALLLAAGNVAALGLGQIEVKSRLNQPLLAEIPIISTTPGELEALQARLASPETFRRVGLAPPSGAAANLQFSLGSDARGRPVIRVTTVAPVNQAVLNFLVEVDWGQGRLVREYSAMVDAPRTTSAPVQPAISAPVVAAPNVVQRPAEPAPVVVPPPAPARPVAPAAVAPAPAPIAAVRNVLITPTPAPITATTLAALSLRRQQVPRFARHSRPRPCGCCRTPP
ncbi:MAG TPA: fimbrial protein FimV, partial [Thermomonas sp.]|nr:fimbrial protein FimV [Thermomonas sp.]